MGNALHDLLHLGIFIEQDDLGNLYVHDGYEGLTFVRGKLSNDKYDLAVIIEEDNPKYGKYMDILSPEQPCGFQILDEISLKEWGSLAKNYLRNKCRGSGQFNEWLKKEIYNPLGKMLHEESRLYESMPYPDAPDEDWANFKRTTSASKS